MYGISQNQDTKDYIIIFQDKYYKEYGKKYCEKCIKEYTDIAFKWCKSCQIKTNQTNGNENIDDFIQDMQLEINSYHDMVCEWIPFNQFNNIKEISKDGFFTIYSAIWKNGQLNYDEYKKIYKRNLRNQNQKVSLKCYNSQNITDEFLNEVQNFLINLFILIFFSNT